MTPRDDFNWKMDSGDDVLLNSQQHSASFFFSGAGRGQQLEHLLHLSRFSQLVLLVVGQDGLGKTTLLKEFLRHKQSGMDIAYIDVSLFMDTLTMLENIAKQWDISLEPNAEINDYLIAFVNYIQSGIEEGRYAIFVIDNADQLDDDALVALYRLFGSPVATQLHFILSASDMSFTQRLSQLPYYRQTHTMDLQPLNEEDTLSYLEDYCAANDLGNVVSEEDAMKIDAAAHGNIAQINLALRDLLSDSIQSNAEDYHERAVQHSPTTPSLSLPNIALPKLKMPSPLQLFFGTIAIICAVALVVLTKLESHAPKPIVIAQTSLIPANSAATPANSNTANSAQELTVAINTPAPIAPTTAPATLAPTKITVAEQMPTAVPAKPTTAPVVASAPEKPKATPTKIAKVVAPKIEKTIKAEKPAVAATAMSGAYTLQVMGSFSEASITNLIHSNPSPLWKRYKATREGKAWFVASYGQYPSPAAAKAASAKLPPAIKKLNPWPRLITDIK